MLRKTLIVFYCITCIFSLSLNVSSEPSKTMGQSLSHILVSVVKGNMSFPARFGVVSQVPIHDPDLQMKVKSDYVNRVITGFLRKPLSLEQDGMLSKSFIKVQNISIKPDPRRNVLLLNVYGGVLYLGGALSVFDGKLALNKAQFEIAPGCRKDQYGVALELDIRCVYLEVKGVTQKINIGIAQILQEKFLNRHPVKPIFLTKFLRSYTADNGPGYRVQSILTHLSVIVSMDGIEFKTKWNVI